MPKSGYSFARAIDQSPSGRTELAPGLKVLLAEDDDADAYLICRVLADHPRVAMVMHVWDGVDAIELINKREIEPDLAIIDLHMPRRSGFGVLLDLACRQESPCSSVVLTSSKASSDSVRSKIRGANEFLTKPDTVEELEVALGRVISGLGAGGGATA